MKHLSNSFRFTSMSWHSTIIHIFITFRFPSWLKYPFVDNSFYKTTGKYLNGKCHSLQLAVSQSTKKNTLLTQSIQQIQPDYVFWLTVDGLKLHKITRKAYLCSNIIGYTNCEKTCQNKVQHFLAKIIFVKGIMSVYKIFEKRSTIWSYNSVISLLLLSTQPYGLELSS
jgi:hypothetical protein